MREIKIIWKIWEKSRTFAAKIMTKDGGIDYDELERTARAVEEGRAVLDRFSLAEEVGRIRGGRRNVEASLLAGRNYSRAREIEQRSTGEQKEVLRYEEKQREARLIERWAKDVGIWEEWDEATTRRPLINSTGLESLVYRDITSNNVIKIIDPYQLSNTLLGFLDNRITLHNYLFPDTTYTLLEVTKKGDTIDFILKQPFIHGANIQAMNFSNSILVNNYLKNLKKTGLTIEKNYYTIAFNDNYVVHDLHEGNVFINDKGQCFFIDTVPFLNTSDMEYNRTRKYGSGNVISLSTNVFNNNSNQPKGKTLDNTGLPLC
jgi:hypothetical protein